MSYIGTEMTSHFYKQNILFTNITQCCRSNSQHNMHKQVSKSISEFAMHQPITSPQGPWPRKPINFLDNDTLVETDRWWCLRSAARRVGDPVWSSDAMLDSGWFGVIPIFVRSGGVPVNVRSGGVPVNARIQNELTSECRRNVSLVWIVLEQSTELSMPDGCSKVLLCRGTNREIGSVQLAENACLLTDEGCSLTVLAVHKRSNSRLVRFFRLVRLHRPGCRFPDAVRLARLLYVR